MLDSTSFLTIQKNSNSVLKERGSKFYSFCLGVKTEVEVKNHLKRLKKLHPSANHYCYAWRIGSENHLYRSSDDGEPSGSAGKPILGQLLSHQLTNVLIVIIRYFGGTQLGMSGLIQAYKSAAAVAIELAGVKVQFIMYEYSISFGMEDESEVMRLLKECDCRIVSNNFEEINTVIFELKKEKAIQLEERTKELYRTKLSFLKSKQ